MVKGWGKPVLRNGGARKITRRQYFINRRNDLAQKTAAPEDITAGKPDGTIRRHLKLAARSQSSDAKCFRHNHLQLV